MAGQQALQDFLNTPGAGKAAPTQIVPRKPAASAPGDKAAPTTVLTRPGQKASGKDTPQATDQEGQSPGKKGKGEQKGQGAQAAAKELQNRLSGVGDRLTAWADSVPTPGGIGLLLIAIFVLIWAIVPVNGGKTRLQLFWLTVTGRTRMADTPDAGGTYTDPGTSTTPGTGSGGSNGHSVNATADLLSQLSIRDFGSSV